MNTDIWDEGKVETVAKVLGTVDQLIIDSSIMEEMKTYHQNLAAAFEDYKEAYDKVHHHWMLRVYKWTGIPGNVITLLSSLMEKWKTRLEIWKDRKKVPVYGLLSNVVFSKVTAIHALVFVFLKSQYVNYSKNAKDTVWDIQERET